jgi:hypothetical protein
LDALAAPAAIRAHVGVDEPIALREVDADAAVPSELADLALEDARIDAALFARLNDSEVNRMTERVLAMRGDVTPLLSHHLVELRASISAYELDAWRAGGLMTLGERSQQIEEPRVERVALSGHSIRKKRGKSRLGGARIIERNTLVGVGLNEGREERMRSGHRSCTLFG